MKEVLRKAGAPGDKVFVTPCQPFIIGPPSTRHIMGTLRIGPEPATSVTNADGRFHDYVTDGSLFPTSSGYNPTLTIIAVALKIAHGIAGTPPEIG